jgi:hypothetical protein
MKSFNIQPYKTLDWVRNRCKIGNNNSDPLEIHYGINFEFSATSSSRNGIGDVPLDHRIEGSSITLNDFSIHEKGLKIKVQVHVEKLAALFKGEKAVATPGDLLAAALVWDSKDSLQRGASEPSCLEYGKSTSSTSFELEHFFQARQLRNSMTFRVGLFLQNPCSSKRPSELANLNGAYLGTLIGPWSIALEGAASLFPIIIDDTLDAQSSPWSLKLDYGDPLEDGFSPEHFAIVINKNNSDSKFILPPDENLRAIQPALKEIVAAALALLIHDVRKNSSAWALILRDESAPGSIGAAVNYIHYTLGADSPEQHKLISQIRSKL